jgi:hypothetical protein
VDAAAGFAGAACAGFVPPAGAALAGLAAGGAVPDPAGPELCANAGAVASIVATATIVILRICDALGMRRDGADVENQQARVSKPNKSVGPDPQSRFRKCSPGELRSD